MSEEMSREQKRDAAKGLFVKSNMTGKEISVLLGVTEKSVSEWRRKYNWDDDKRTQNITRQSLLADAYKQMDAINKSIADKGGIPDKNLSDAKAQCIREIERFSDTPTHLYVSVFEDFCAWLSKHAPKQLITVSQLGLQFIESKKEE